MHGMHGRIMELTKDLLIVRENLETDVHIQFEEGICAEFDNWI